MSGCQAANTDPPAIPDGRARDDVDGDEIRAVV